MEYAASFTILFVGLGFFLVVMLVVLRSDRESFHRREYSEDRRHQRKMDDEREAWYRANSYTAQGAPQTHSN